MADGVSVSERADEQSDAVWDACEACGARRRLENGLCYMCATDPLKVELVDLRKRVHGLDEQVKQLEASKARQLYRLKEMRAAVKPLLELSGAARVLPLTEDEYLMLVSIMLDVVEDDKTFETLALDRKLRALAQNRIPPDV